MNQEAPIAVHDSFAGISLLPTDCGSRGIINEGV